MRLPVFKDPVTNEPSFSVTVAAITFAVVLVKWMLGNQTILTHEFKPISMEEVRGWLDPTLIFYTVRQGTKAVEAVASAKIEKGTG